MARDFRLSYSFSVYLVRSIKEDCLIRYLIVLHRVPVVKLLSSEMRLNCYRTIPFHEMIWQLTPARFKTYTNRKDLTPNVCAVYVEENYRCQGIAGKLLEYVCEDMRSFGLETLYLITDHTGFYERYGWKFLCMAQGDGEVDLSRMYVYDLK